MKYRALFLLLMANPGQLSACDFCNSVMGINPYYMVSDALHVSMLFQRSGVSPEECI